MTASALVAADAALKRGEVPTVPHTGSPVLLSELRPRGLGQWAWWWHFDALFCPVTPESSGARVGRYEQLLTIALWDAAAWRATSPAQPRE